MKRSQKKLGEKVKFVELDVTKRDAWENAIKKTEEAFGPIDVLVNNAGIDIMKKFIDFTEDELQKILQVNLFSQFHGMQTVLPSMKKAGGGSIINISSLEDLRGTAGNSIYNASKFVVTDLTQAVPQEYAEFNIRVNSVHPGAIKTPGIEADDIKDVVQDYFICQIKLENI